MAVGCRDHRDWHSGDRGAVLARHPDHVPWRTRRALEGIARSWSVGGVGRDTPSGTGARDRRRAWLAAQPDSPNRKQPRTVTGYIAQLQICAHLVLLLPAVG